MPIPRLHRDRLALLVIDVQERLLPTIALGEAVAHNCGVLMDVARELTLPTIVTEQYVKGLGGSVASIAGRVATSNARRVEKTRFSAMVPETWRALREARDGEFTSSVLVCGIEAHVCVLQTCLDLLAGGCQVFVAHDAVASGDPGQVVPALERLRDAGAILTGVLGATYELLSDATDPRFRSCLALVKSVRPVSHVR